MSNVVVITGVGRDRVGIVAELAQMLFELGCNLLDSSMTLLRGEFALIVMAELPAAVSFAKVEEHLHSIEKQIEMTFNLRILSDAELEEPSAEENRFIVSVYGADKPGIVAQVTKALTQNKLNITDVQTKSTGGTHKIFVMILEVTAPQSVSIIELEQKMSALALEVAVDINVQALDVIEL